MYYNKTKGVHVIEINTNKKTLELMIKSVRDYFFNLSDNKDEQKRFTDGFKESNPDFGDLSYLAVDIEIIEKKLISEINNFSKKGFYISNEKKSIGNYRNITIDLEGKCKSRTEIIYVFCHSYIPLILEYYGYTIISDDDFYIFVDEMSSLYDIFDDEPVNDIEFPLLK